MVQSSLLRAYRKGSKYMTNLKTWAIKTGFLAIKTAAQTAIGVIGGASLVTEVNWAVVGSSVLLAIVTTFLMHVGDLDVDGMIEQKEKEKSLG